jgi:hypothetical protein
MTEANIPQAEENTNTNANANNANNANASPLPRKLERHTWTSCQICKKPLGQESRDLGYPLCHTCRKCASCGTETLPSESIYCLENQHPIKHARCMSVSDGQTLQQQVSLANYIRQMPSIEKAFVNADFDTQFQFMRDMQSLCAFMSNHLNMKRADVNKRLNEERQAEKRQKAEKERKAQTTETKAFKKSKNLLAQAISAYTKYGVDYGKAAHLIYDNELKKGTDPLKARLLVIEAMVALGSREDQATEIFDRYAKQNNS